MKLLLQIGSHMGKMKEASREGVVALPALDSGPCKEEPMPAEKLAARITLRKSPSVLFRVPRVEGTR